MSGLDESTEPAEHEAPQAHTQGEEAAPAAIEEPDLARPNSGPEQSTVPDLAETPDSTGLSEADPAPEPTVNEPANASADASGSVVPEVVEEPADASGSVVPEVVEQSADASGSVESEAPEQPADASGSVESEAPEQPADASGSAESEAPEQPADASEASQSDPDPAAGAESGPDQAAVAPADAPISTVPGDPAAATDASELARVASEASADASELAGVAAEARADAPGEAVTDSAPAPAPAPAPEQAHASAEPAAATPQIGATKEAGTGKVVQPKAPRPKSITETGKIVEGVVTAVSADSVELTLDDGRHAVINRPNFSLTDEEPSAVLSAGDRAFGAELAREDPKARVVLSRTWALKRQAWEKIVDHASNNKLLSGKVVSANKKGLVIDVGVRGFVPASHLELEPVADMSPYVGQTLELKILEVDPRREKLVLSRRSQLLKAQRKEIQELLQSLKPGEVRSGTVASIADYGAFVDLGGVSGLVHISELSWQRVGKPAQVVSVGDKVEVKILDIKPKKKRISLSMRQVTPDPLKSIEVGSVLVGAVTRLVDFGAFVAIGDFEGLVHLSELAEYRVSTPEEIVAPGDEVGVKVLSIDTKRRRIELSIRRAAEYGG